MTLPLTLWACVGILSAAFYAQSKGLHPLEALLLCLEASVAWPLMAAAVLAVRAWDARHRRRVPVRAYLPHPQHVIVVLVDPNALPHPGLPEEFTQYG